MGKVWMPGGGGGTDLDVVTAGKSDVLAGKVIVDKDGEPLTGTMPNNGAVSQALNAGGSYAVPAGYHNGSGKVTANSLASQTSATATAAHILSGQTAWVNGTKVNGGIPWQNADVSGTDRAWATNISCWEGTACLGVRNAYYLNGVNWIQGNIPNFYAANIKKGVNMGGLVGTFEGYVPSPSDLYLRGNNISGIREYNRGSATNVKFNFEAAQIGTSSSNLAYWLGVYRDLTGYNYVNFESYHGNGGVCGVAISASNAGDIFDTYNEAVTRPDTVAGTTTTISVNVSAINAARWIKISVVGSHYIYRIWLS